MREAALVIPSILTDDVTNLAKIALQAEGFADYVQFDIMDGEFVPSHSIVASDISNLHTKLNWEAHLMVLRPENYLGNFKRAGAKKIVFHYEATASPAEIISKIHKLGMKAGLAINPGTPLNSIGQFTSSVDSVLFLAVYPGFYGSPFIPEVLDKVTEFQRLYPNLETGLDGGVKEDNIAQIAKTGIKAIYVGSAIFLQKNPTASYRRLASLAAGARDTQN